MTRFDTIERAVADIAAGKAVVVVDDEDRENEGDLIFAAADATPELVAFMVRSFSSNIIVNRSLRARCGSCVIWTDAHAVHANPGSGGVSPRLHPGWVLA